MARQRFSLPDDQMQELTTAYATAKVGRVRTRYQAVRLYGTGYPVEEVRDITGWSRTRPLAWWRTYSATGLAGLIDQRKPRTRAKLTASPLQALRPRSQTYTPAAVFGAATASTGGLYWLVDALERAVERWYQV